MQEGWRLRSPAFFCIKDNAKEAKEKPPQRRFFFVF